MGIKGIFGQLFGSESEQDPREPSGLNWKWLEDMDTWEGILNSGDDQLHVVFKNSSSCGISNMMLRRFERSWPEAGPQYFLLDVRRHREVSDRIAADLGCRHESPQVLLVREGQLLGHASHGDIQGLRPESFFHA